MIGARWLSRTTISALCLMLCVAVTGCGGSSKEGEKTPTGEPRDGGDLIVGVLKDPQSLNPFNATDQTSADVIGTIFDTLFVPGQEGGEAEPSLAAGITFSPDKLTATISLRSGVTFQDGSTFEAEDVVFSLQEAMKSPDFGSIFDFVKDIKSDGEDSVILSLKRPQTDLPEPAHAVCGFNCSG